MESELKYGSVTREMKISVRVKANSKKEKIDKTGELLTVYVKEPARENKANLAVINLLAEYFKVPKSQISIVSGQKSKQKVVDVIKTINQK